MTGAPPTRGARATLLDLYGCAVAAASPDRAVRAALAAGGLAGAGPARLIAVGKAAHAMAAAAVAALADAGRAPAGGVVVAPNAAPPPHAHLVTAVGSHPVPDARSAAAAEAIGAAVAQVRPGDDVVVLLSGGATSLAAGPVDGATAAELAELSRLLLGSGLDIAAMNAVRKRFSRWSGGRLAAALAACAPARVRCLVVSDVIGDDLAAIGSGPCVPDPVTAPDLRARLREVGLWDALPAGLRALVDAAARDPARETPKPGHPAFAAVETSLVVSNRLSLDAVVARAAALGIDALVVTDALAGEAALVGRALGRAVAELAGATDGRARALVWGGETTVTLGATPGLGGRCQELALAASAELAGRGGALLAAGTDGRDGPTDAAGAVVDAGTWDAAAAAGRDPARDLAAHDAHPALAAAGALVPAAFTGTNVMDVMVGLAGGGQ